MKKTSNHQIIHHFLTKNLKTLIVVKQMLSKNDYFQLKYIYISAV